MRTTLINDSDLIRVAEYDPEEHTMWLTFMDGTAYVYDNVDGSTYGGIVGAESIGAKANAFFKTNKGTKLNRPDGYCNDVALGLKEQVDDWKARYEKQQS